jgi:radical SAM additional 4Fe4S-binding domain
VCDKLFNSENLIKKYSELPIDSILLEMTTRCNKNCSYCYGGFNQGGKDISNEVLKSIYNFISENNVKHVSISGGEPLLYANLDDILDHLTYLGCNIEIITNGLLVDKNASLFLGRSNLKLKISADIHNVQYIEIIKKVQEYKIPLALNITIYGLEPIESITRYIRDLYNISGITVNVNFPFFKGNAEFSNNYVEYLPNLAVKLVELFLFEKLPVEGQFVSVPVDNYFSPKRSVYKNCTICKSLKIDVNGNYFPCPYFTNSKYCMGNVSCGGINNELCLRTMEESFSQSKNEGCLKCRWYAICSGGCLAAKETHPKHDYSCVVSSKVYDYLNSIFGRY